jgi:hypothetical protein
LYILWLFGIFFPFWYVAARKIWQPWVKARRMANSRERLLPETNYKGNNKNVLFPSFVIVQLLQSKK